MDNNMSNARIQLHLNIHEPIELVDMTKSFQAIAFQYKKYLVEEARAQNKKIDDSEVKLYITKIESNCILAELGGAIAILGSLFPLMNYTNVFVQFAQNVERTISWCRGVAKAESVDPKGIPYAKGDLDRVAQLTKIASECHGGELGIDVIEYVERETEKEKVVHLSVKYTSEEAYQARKGALVAMQALEYTADADHKNMLMYFYQTNTDEPKANGRTGDKAIIKSLHKKPLPVYFLSELDQQKITYLIHDEEHNPLKISLNVDVNVETDRNDKPIFYRVLRVHEIYPEDDT
jgi:hypothetical protein